MNNALDFWRGGFSTSPQKTFDRLFEDLAGARLNADLAKYSFNPSCEVAENRASYMVKFDLPGISKDQIKIDLHDGYLTVSGERKEEKKEDDKKRHFSEVYYGSFSRSFSFPTSVDAEKTEAKYENGVLLITVPKMAANGARQITVR